MKLHMQCIIIKLLIKIIIIYIIQLCGGIIKAEVAEKQASCRYESGASEVSERVKNTNPAKYESLPAVNTEFRPS